MLNSPSDIHDNNHITILSALSSIDVASCTRDEWLRVGMALKAEGFPCSVWDDWSRVDLRYHPGECERLWNGFREEGNIVKGGSIIQLAKDTGWVWTLPKDDALCMAWDDTIEFDGESFQGFGGNAWDAVGDFRKYLETLFDADDKVAYVTNDVWQTEDGRWVPSKGAYDRTAGELLDSLKANPKDLGATLGDWKPEAGAWIRFNPVDGNGVKNENVTKFRYALVESDSISIQEQDVLFRKWQLPIATLVHSGGKSLHAIVRVDAENYDEYRKRVEFLYDFLEKHGVSIDKQNRNPSRLSRMPGVTRNGNRQYLVDTNIGRKSWNDWMDFVEGVSDELPPMATLMDVQDNPPPLPKPLIKGVLRKGHKMLIAGSSKAGKSFLLMELAIAIAEGRPWLGMICEKGRVLYVNLEIDPASAIHRFLRIYRCRMWPMNHTDDIVIWNLRGHAVPLDELVPKLIRRIRNDHFDAIIIDPIYKVIMGDENNASDMGRFANQFDKICNETGCSVIYCHHHSKGAQGNKRAIDRASGSGVFARDPDAQLDMIQLDLMDQGHPDGSDGVATAWRMEFSLREFKSKEPVDFWFEYPIHSVDVTGTLKEYHPLGSHSANLAHSPNRTTQEERKDALDSAYKQCRAEPPVRVSQLAKIMGVSDKTVRRYLNEFEDTYWLSNGVVGRKD